MKGPRSGNRARAAVAVGPDQDRLVLLMISGLSGAVALGYEILWSRMLSLHTGHDIWSYAIVGSAFMAGLALGSYLLDLRLDRGSCPLATYRRLELGIGAWAGLFPLGLAGLDRVVPWLRAAGVEADTVAPLIAILGGLLVLVPATLMGGTLPALARALGARRGDPDGLQSGVRTPDRSGSPDPLPFGLLYGCNCAGAALGALLVTFYVVAGLGHFRTGLLLAVGNLVLAGLSRGVTHTLPAGVGGSSRDGGAGRRGVRGVAPRLGVVVAVAGAASMATQLLWTRGLVLVIGSSTYAFAIVLSVYIASLAAGSFLSRFASRIDPLRALTACLAGLGLASLAGRVLLSQIPLWAIVGYGSRQYLDPVRLGWNLALAFLAVGPTAILSGALLPIAIRAHESAGGRASVGSLYALNTSGAILGNVAAGFVLLPVLGLESSFSVIGLVSLATALIPGPRFLARQRLIAAAPALVAAFVLLSLPGPDPEILHCGPYVAGSDYLQESRTSGRPLDEVVRGSGRILHQSHGPFGLVGVKELPGQGRALLVNGKPDASTSLDMKAQRLLAHLPMALRPHARDALVIGLGSGVTAGSFLAHPLDRLTVAEISPEVVEASRYFRQQNRDPLSDRRTRLVMGDARSTIRYLGESWDIISSEPTNPWIAGVASLFTREFFAELRSHLRPGGLAVQWLQGYSIHPDDFRSIVATFRSEFPGSYLFRAFGGSDYLLVGTDGRVELDLDQLAEIFTRPVVKRDLADIDIYDAPDIACHLLATPKMLEAFASGQPLQTDDRLALEFSGPRHLNSSVGVWIEPVLQGDIPALLVMADPDGTLAGELEMRLWRYVAYDHLQSNQFEDFQKALDRATAMAVERGSSQEFLRTLYLAVAQRLQQVGELDRAEGGLRRFVSLYPDVLSYRTELATVLTRKGRFEEAVAILDEVLARDPDNLEANRGLAVLHEAGGQPGEALDYYRRLARLQPHDARLDVALSRVLEALGRHEAADATRDRALRKDPALVLARGVAGLENTVLVQ